MKRTLQIVGLGALGLWGLGGAYAWFSAAAHFDVTIVESSDATPTDLELAMLRDRTETLARDVGGLTDVLAANFGLLVESLERTDAEVAALGRALDQRARTASDAAAASSVERLGATLEACVARLEQLDRAGEAPSATSAADVVVASTDPPASGAESTPAAGSGADGPDDGTPPAPGTPDPAPEEPASVPDEAPARAGFLAFRLPSQDLRFDEPREFTILSSLSRVGFDATSTLHDFSGATQAVTGTFRAALEAPEEGLTGSLEVRSAALTTGLDDRDSGMHELLGAEAHESMRFDLESFEPDDRAAGTDAVATGTVRGTLTIAGIARSFSMPVVVRVDESRRAVVDGEAPLRMSDFGIEAPNQLGVISVEDEVRVWIRLRARAVPRSEP